MRETRMNTASQYRSVSLPISLIQFVLGNGMEGVIGSIPIRSTNPYPTWNRANQQSASPD